MNPDPLLTSRCHACHQSPQPCWQCERDHDAVRALRARAARFDQELAERERPRLSGMELWKAAVQRQEGRL